MSRWESGREPCEHQRYQCLRCANTGCTIAGCARQGFDSDLCRSCGHFEKRPLQLGHAVRPSVNASRQPA